MSTCYKQRLFYECKRLFPKWAWVWITICFVINIVIGIHTYQESEQDITYKEVVNQYVGISKQEKISEIYSRAEYYSQILDDHAAISEKYAKNEISDEDYAQFIADYKYAKNHLDAWLRLQENALRYEKQESTTHFLYDVSWTKLFENKIQWVFSFLMIMLLIPYFFLDRESSFYVMGESYYRYKKQERYRLYLAVAVIMLIQVLWDTSELLVLLSLSSLPNPTAPACSLEIMEQVNPKVSLLVFYVIQNITFLVKRILDVVITFFVALKCKNQMVTTVIMLVYLLVTNFYFTEFLKWILAGL